jgi:DGQHR domain-containing protein
MAGQQQTETERQKAIAAFKEKNKGKQQGNTTVHGEVKQSAATVAEQEEEKRIIEPKTFPVIQYKQGKLDCAILSMTMADIHDYTCFARDLYDVQTVTDEKGKIKNLPVDPEYTWQRDLTKGRLVQIRDYLLNDLHFFPAIVCVVSNDATSIDANGLRIGFDNDGNPGLAVLDGQHRKAGIDTLLAVDGMGPDSAFGKEQVSVIVITSAMDVDTKQQIFADVNRTAKVVSKALNILFDHRDPFAVIAHNVAKQLDGLVDLQRTAPKGSSSQALSLSNIYNLAINYGGVKKKGSKEFEAHHSAELVEAVVLSICNALPQLDAFRVGAKYEDVRQQHIVYSSTLMQAIGLAAKQVTRAVGRTMNANKEVTAIDPRPILDLLPKLIARTNWHYNNPVWSEIIEGEEGKWKVKTRSGDVSKAQVVLEEMWGAIKDEN